MGPKWGALQALILLLVLVLLLSAQLFWFRSAWRALKRIGSPKWILLLRTLVVAALLWLIVVLADRLFLHFLPRSGPTRWIMTLAQLWLVPSFFAFLLVKLVHGIEWIWDRGAQLFRRTPPASPTIAQNTAVDLGRRSFFRYAAAAAGAAPLLAALYGFARERLQFTVHRVEVPVANLPPALDGFRIVQLSDIHVGSFMPPEQIRRAVDMANGLGAQVAVVTGDFLTGAGDPLDDCIAELSRLQSPLGTWGCNGNHEIYADAEETAQQLFQKYGMRLLRQENAPLRWNGQEINLVGVDYQRERFRSGAHAPMLSAIEPLIRRDVPNLLLSHNPNSFYRAAELGIELSLAGHTHGGQVQVEIVDHRWNPARFITKFIAGLYSLPLNGTARRSFLYVNRGLGTIGVPARLGVDPEVTLLTLRTQG
ncbi:MAG TPA: metallophosphoesterase [Terriglobales bacterium]|nr:metallophosphoesterase [Terriglobales bacterium]